MTNSARPKLRPLVTETLCRRWRVVAGTVLLSVGLTAALTFTTPKRYQAEAKLTLAPLEDARVSTVVLQIEMDRLQSQAVARRALGTGAQEEQLQRLAASLRAETVPEPHRIRVTMQGTSPAAAREQLARVLKAYFAERSGTPASAGEAAFFGKQTDEHGEQLTLAQQKLTEFEGQHGIADLDEQKKLQVQRIATLEDQLDQVRMTLAQKRSRNEADKRQLSLTPARSGMGEPPAADAGSKEHLGTSLVALVNRRAELLKTLPPTDPQVAEVNAKIEATQKAIAGSSKPADPAGDVNPVYKQLSSQVAASTDELRTAVAQANEIAVELKQAKARLEELEQATATDAELKRNVAQAQGDYNLYAQKRAEVRNAEELDTAKMFAVSLAELPTASSTPVRPRPALSLGLAFAASLLLGTLLAFLADAWSRFVYTPAQLDALTGIPTLAMVAEDAIDNRPQYRSVLLALKAKDAHCVAFTSALSGEGLTELVARLATEAARQHGSRVAVMDVAALLRKFAATNDAGFAMKLEEAAAYWVLDLSAERAEAAMPVRGNTQQIFAERLSPMLEEMRSAFDCIFLDCPSLETSALAPALDRCVDGFVAVVTASQTRKQEIRELATTLGDTRSPLFGYVLRRS